MEVDLPPVIAVRAFLREQRARRNAFHAWCDETFQRDWKKAGRSKLSGATLHAFATALNQALDGSAAIGLWRQGSPDRLKLRTPSTYKVRGNVLWPVNLGQNANSPGSAYVEEAAMIVEARAQISNTKVAISEAPLCLGWTRHTLERLCERGIGATELENVLKASINEIGQALALALFKGLFKPATGADNANTAWIPYRGGLLVFTDRYLSANVSHPEVGWRFDYRNGRYSAPNIRADFTVPYISHASYRGPGMIIATVWLATTFLGADLLRAEQRRYAEAFTRVMSMIPESEVARLFHIRFDPAHRIDEILQKPVALNDEAAGGIAEAKARLAGDAFKALPRGLGTIVLNDDATTRAFRLDVQKLRGS